MSTIAMRSNVTNVNVMTKLALILITVILLLAGSIGTASASTFTVPSQDAAKLAPLIQSMSINKVDPKDGGDMGGAIFKVNGTAITFDKETFESGTPSTQKAVLKAYVEAVNNSKMTNTGKRKAMNGVQEASGTANKMLVPMVIDDSSADMYGGYQIIKGGMPLIKQIFGILAYLIIFGLILSTLLDLIYAGMPFARNFGGKDGGDSKPGWVTADMYSAVKDAESGENYSNVYGKYFLRRSWTYVLLVLCVVFLVMGEMGSLISLIMSLGDGFLQGGE